MSSSPPLFVVILAGGAGTRLWPVSTRQRPKQFRPLVGEKTLLQMTWDRVANLAAPEQVIVMTNARFGDVVGEQLPALPADNVVVEPAARDTAGAIALAAVIARARAPESTMAVLPADHVIRPRDAFHRALRAADELARQSGALVTFGVTPVRPATGYGYLERGEAIGTPEGVPAFRLLGFREKPDEATARELVAQGRFYWNSGMFVWTVEAIWQQLSQHLPRHVELLGPLEAKVGHPDFDGALAAAFPELPRISIDYGVMEKAAGKVQMLEAPFDWSDIGGWPALADYLEHDGGKNAHRGRLATQDAEGNIVFCEDPSELVALIGVRDLVVVRAGDKTMVTTRDHADAGAIKALTLALAEKDA